MRGRPLNMTTVGRAAGFALVAIAIAATAIHFRHDGARRNPSPDAPAIQTDPLAPELARCQAIGMAAKDDPACETAWAENRRRFFSDHPASSLASTPPDARVAPQSEGH